VLVGVALGCERGSVVDPPDAAALDRRVRAHLTYSGVFPLRTGAPQDPALVELGRALFFDKVLSGNRDVACATCHDPRMALGDGRSLSVGTGAVANGSARGLGPGRHYAPRNAPSLLNPSGLTDLFWDGRVSEPIPRQFRTPAGDQLPEGLNSLLAVQAMFPVANRNEMRGEVGDRDVLGAPNELALLADGDLEPIWDAVMARVLAIPEYATRFRAAYPGLPLEGFGFEHAANAIAAFEVHAFTFLDSPFDRYVAGQDDALTEEEKEGALLFYSREPRCSGCHFGPMLGSKTFAATGTPQVGPGIGADAPLDRGMTTPRVGETQRFIFRAPPLRNVELSAPYMHAGSYATLDAVVKHYSNVERAVRAYDASQLDPVLRAMYHGDQGTIDALLAALDPRLRIPFEFDEQDTRQMVAFLKSLTDPAARDLTRLAPASVPSGLPVP
jgi:cytochrome c peroxidase